MAELENNRAEWTEGTTQESENFQATSESSDGLAVTQELVSDMYKMGTIDDREGAD